jgi:hypothetical protein
MMSIELSGAVYQIEGLLYAGRPACSLRKACGRPVTKEDFDRLSVEDETRLRILVRRHIEAVALLAGVRAPNAT